MKHYLKMSLLAVIGLFCIVFAAVQDSAYAQYGPQYNSSEGEILDPSKLNATYEHKDVTGDQSKLLRSYLIMQLAGYIQNLTSSNFNNPSNKAEIYNATTYLDYLVQNDESYTGMFVAADIQNQINSKMTNSIHKQNSLTMIKQIRDMLNAAYQAPTINVTSELSVPNPQSRSWGEIFYEHPAYPSIIIGLAVTTAALFGLVIYQAAKNKVI